MVVVPTVANWQTPLFPALVNPDRLMKSPTTKPSAVNRNQWCG